MDRLKLARAAELNYLNKKNVLELKKKAALDDVESTKFASMVNTLGAATIAAIATAGPDMQVLFSFR